MTPWATMPPESSRSVGSRSSPPIVVEVRSPIVWTELTMYMTASEMQALALKVMPKCSGAVTANQPDWATAEKETIPIASATI